MYKVNRILALLVIVSLIFIPFSAAQNLFENEVSAQEVETNSFMTDDPQQKSYILDREHKITTEFNASSSDSAIFSQKEGSRTIYTFFDNSTGEMTPVERVYINDDEGGETERAYIVKVNQEELPDFQQFVGVTGVEKTGSFTLEGMKGFSLIASEQEINNLKESQDVTVYRDELVKVNLADSVPQIGGDKLKKWGLKGSQIDVGVIDTGVDYSHPSLGGCSSNEFSNGNCEKVEGGYDFYSGDKDPMDENGHGTHVASTIASTNDTYEGVAPASDIYGYRVLGPNGYGSSSDIIDAIERSVDPNGDGNTSDHLDIISLSLGGPGTANSAKAEAINSAVENGVLAVVAAGNDGSSYRTVGSPGNAKKALSVGAVDGNDDIAYFSSRGPVYYSNGSTAGIKPDLVAPGVGINAAWIDGGWNSISGTSMATPHVSGAAALLMQDRDLEVQETRSVLKTTSNDLGKDAYTQGAGRINLTQAVNASVSFNRSTVFMGEVDSNSFAKTFNVGLLPGDDSATVSFHVENPDNLESSGGCSPSFSFSANDTKISSESGKDITMNVDSAGSCSGILEGHITAVVNSDGSQIEHTLPYSFVKENYLDINVHDSSGSDTSAKAYISDASHGDTVDRVSLTGGSSQVALPKGNYVITGLKLTQKEIFALQKEINTSKTSSVTLDASSATSVNYPGTWNGNNLWHRTMEIGFYNNETFDTGSVGGLDMEAIGDQTVYVSKVADNADIDWDISLSGVALKQKDNICSDGCGREADVYKEVANDIYTTAATFDKQVDVGDVTFTETQTTDTSIAYPGHLANKTEYDRTVSWKTDSYLGPFLSTDTAVPTSITTHQLEGAQADYDLTMDVGPWEWDQTLPSGNTGGVASLGELPVLPGKASSGFYDFDLDNLLRGQNGNTEFQGEGKPTLRIYENGSKTLDQKDNFYWYGINRDLKDNTDYRFELEMSMIDSMPAWNNIETHYDITTGSDRVSPYFSKIEMPVKFTGSSVDFNVRGEDNKKITRTAVYYRYRSSGDHSSWNLANEDSDSKVSGSIPKNGFDKVDVKLVTEDSSGNTQTMIVEDAVVEPKNVGFEMKGPSDAGTGTEAVYQGICQVHDSNCQGLKVFKNGNTAEPRRVISEQDATEGYGIAGTFEETVTLPSSGDNYTYTFSFPGMNAYESISKGEVSKTTDLITANSDSVVISGTDKSYSSIQKAVNNANSEDTIIVKDTYTGINDTLPLKIDKAVTIKGQGDVTISGRAQHLVMDVNAEPVTIKNLEIVGAAAGILYTQDSTEDTPLTVKNVTLRNLGSSQYGGAVLTTPGVEAVVKDSRFYNNSYGVYSTPDTSDFQKFTTSSVINARETVDSVEGVSDRIQTIREKASQYSSPSELREAIGTDEGPDTAATDTHPVKITDSEFIDNYIGIVVENTDIKLDGVQSQSNNFATSARQYSFLKMTDSEIERNRAALIAQDSGVNVSMTDIADNSFYGVGLISSNGNLEDNWWGSGAGPTPFVQNLYDGQVSEYDRGDILITDSHSAALPIARPWLLGSKNNAETMDQTIAMQPGWNLISTPRRLYESEWGEISSYGNGLNISIAYRYDVESENWAQLDDSHNLKPLEAYYIKASETDGIGFKWQSKGGDTAVRPAVRELDQGWNLVGLAVNAGIERPKSTYMDSKYFLNSVSGVTKEDTGYSTVISPSGNEADWSVFTSNLETDQNYGMYPYEGYWVFMENDDTLAGMNTEEELGR